LEYQFEDIMGLMSGDFLPQMARMAIVFDPRNWFLGTWILRWLPMTAPFYFDKAVFIGRFSFLDST